MLTIPNVAAAGEPAPLQAPAALAEVATAVALTQLRRNVWPRHRPGPAKTLHHVHPHSVERQAKRDRVLRAATILWAQDGIAGDWIGALARHCGMSHSAIHNLLGSRENTLTEIMLAHVANLHDNLCAAARSFAGARKAARLEAMVTALLKVAAAAPHAHFLLHHGLCSVSSHSRDLVRQRYGIVLELVGEPLVELVPTASARTAVALALAALGAMGDALLWSQPPQDTEMAATARRLTITLLAAVGSSEGLGPRPGCGGPVKSCAMAWLAGGMGAGGSVQRRIALTTSE